MCDMLFLFKIISYVAILLFYLQYSVPRVVLIPFQVLHFCYSGLLRPTKDFFA